MEPPATPDMVDERSNDSLSLHDDEHSNPGAATGQTYDRAKVTIYPKKEHFGPDGKRYCSYGGAVCTQRPMRSYDFCVKHILQDPKAPFKQCDYLAKQTNKQCANPVKIINPLDDNRYCNAHKQMLGIIPKGSGPYSKKKKSDKKKDEKEGTPPGKRKKDGTGSDEEKEEVNSETESDDDAPNDGVCVKTIDY
jgi:hypothetical protein